MRDITLNTKQKEAMNHIYGPLLVLAGPGTGKTQLLSARIAHILQETDANAQNILCLTFTENAAQNMRDRLSAIIGSDAYDVHINTYHGFGSDIIRSYPEFFEEIDLETGKDTRLERPIDDLKRIQIVESLLDKLPFSSPLIGARYYINHVVSTISELKRALYTPESLEELAAHNLKCVRELSPQIAAHLADIKRFPSSAEKSLQLFDGIHTIFQGQALEYGLAELAAEELEEALAAATEQQKSTPLTAWKNAWLTKDSQDQFQFTDEAQHLRISELAKLYEKYQQELEREHLYDYDDMILRTIKALRSNDEFRFNLQEKYQFILLDEFQDTNAAQFELVKQLADNPVHEGQPNIFAVGDDDQAIYAFQGARVSNMLGFVHAFRDVKIVNLQDNYRSHPDIINSAQAVAEQIESRLHTNLEGIEKTLTAQATDMPKNAVIERREFEGEANEYAWVSNQIHSLIESGTDPSDIAVLAPKHQLLEGIVPFLAAHETAVSYEKRENILEAPLIVSLKRMVELVLACRDNDEARMNQLLPQVLSLEFYNLPVVNIWQVNWAYRSGSDDRSWAEIAMESDTLAPHVTSYLALGLKSADAPLEQLLDQLTGAISVRIDAEINYISPLKTFYFSDKTSDPLTFYETLTNLSTIRQHLRTHQASTERMLTAQDFLDFMQAYETAGQPLINTHPVATNQNAVQLMTVFKAKGLEFKHVFLLSLHDDIWGTKARTNANKLSLPANLQHIRYQGSSEDELRRILFVALTRAKQGIYLTSHSHKDNGKHTEPVKYLLEQPTEDDTRISTVLPEGKQPVQQTAFSAQETMQHTETLWYSRHLRLNATLKSLLKNRLDNYRMSPTHLNAFIDLEYAGPETFLLQTLLRFPQAPGEDGEFGNAVHGTLDALQKKNEGKEISGEIAGALKEFDKQLAKRYIAPEHTDDYRARGHHALKAYLEARTDMFKQSAKSEVDFRSEGAVIGDAHLSGKIDRLEIDTKAKTVQIVDFKTGKPHTRWERSIKLLKYKQQLYFYKFLIEGSHTWFGYTVTSARLEFVEPDSKGVIVEPLLLSFDSDEEKALRTLIKSIWQKIQQLDLPDTSSYPQNYTGTLEFIKNLSK